MKKIKKIIAMMLMASIIVTITGCYGSFKLTKEVYEWNGKATDDKFANSVIMWALFIVPVYEVCTFIDFVVLNTIEFWTGSNPLAMNEGEFEKKIIESETGIFEITATKNKFHIEKMEYNQTNKSIDLVYDEISGIWSLNNGAINYNLAQGDIHNNEWVRLFYPDGKIENIVLR